MRMAAILSGMLAAATIPPAHAQVPASPPAPQQTPAPLQKIVTPVNPMMMATDDFTRLASPELWQGLGVRRVEFRDDRTFWRLYRIANVSRPGGPLWFVPHDNENAAFQAGLWAVRAYGGVLVAIEEARSVDGPDSRMNGDVAFGQPVDPNRNFRDTSAYAGAILADLGEPPRMIVALHTNEPGYSLSASTCAPPGATYTGKGEISVLLCSDLYTPRRSVSGRWPYDDTDSVAIVSYLGDRTPMSGFCARGLWDADMNIMFEHVVQSDGSLSNYALYHGLAYVNFETQERGTSPEGLADARSRLLAMIDVAMTRCAPVGGLMLKPPPPRPPERREPERKRKRR